MFADKRRAKDQKGDPNAILDTSGSPLAITFKPRYWKQFEKTKGSAHMKNLRKDAVRERHQSTLVVDTHMTSTEDRALSFEAATQIQARLAGGNVLTFSDLLKSMPIFFHLREEELRRAVRAAREEAERLRLRATSMAGKAADEMESVHET